MNKNAHLILFLLCFQQMISSCNSKSDTTSESETNKKCYERITSSNGVTDQLVLTVEFIADSIHGELLWLPQEKDSQRGNISGYKLEESIFDVTYDYSAEGITAREKQSIVFENSMAIITRKGDANSIDTLKAIACDMD